MTIGPTLPSTIYPSSDSLENDNHAKKLGRSRACHLACLAFSILELLSRSTRQRARDEEGSEADAKHPDNHPVQRQVERQSLRIHTQRIAAVAKQGPRLISMNREDGCVRHRDAPRATHYNDTPIWNEDLDDLRAVGST
jgi:hypothetical protein